MPTKAQAVAGSGGRLGDNGYVRFTPGGGHVGRQCPAMVGDVSEMPVPQRGNQARLTPWVTARTRPIQGQHVHGRTRKRCAKNC